MKAAIMVPIVALALGFGPAIADVVVLRDATRLTGTIANHGTIVQSPCTAKSVSILIARADSSELVQIPVGDVAYVIFADGSVFAPVPLETGERHREAPHRTGPIPFSSFRSPEVSYRSSLSTRERGVRVTTTGALMLGAGLLLYEAQSVYAVGTVPGAAVTSVLVVGGGVITVAGVAMMLQTSGPNALRDPGAKTLYAGLSTRF